MAAPIHVKMYFMQAYMRNAIGDEAKSSAPALKPSGTCTALSSGCAADTICAADVKFSDMRVTK